MGRNSTGAITTSECMRIDIGNLLKNGYIKKGCTSGGYLSWTYSNGGDAGCVYVLSDLTSEEKFIKIVYGFFYPDTGKKKIFICKVFIDVVPSNLGKGEVLYFICPVTRQRCRILYNAYGCKKWKSRQGFEKPIYYPLQQCSKFDRANTKYWMLDGKLSKLSQKRIADTYNGKNTKRAISTEKKYKELKQVDYIRRSQIALPERCLTFAKEHGIELDFYNPITEN